MCFIFLIFWNNTKQFQLLECSKLPVDIKNGNVIVINKREITFKCYQGYFLSTEINNFVCKNDGNWNSDDLNPKCIKSKNVVNKFI